MTDQHIPPATSASVVCRRPFENVEVQWDGGVYICSPSWTSEPIGNLMEGTLEQIWQSEKAHEIRRAVLDGSFGKCNATLCPHLGAYRAGKALVPGMPILAASSFSESLIATRQYPHTLNLAYDFSCQLACAMCRSGVRKIARGTSDAERVEWITDRLIEFLPNVQRIKIAGAGEPFESVSYMRIMRSLDRAVHSNLKVFLHTNGLRMSEENWAKHPNMHEFVDQVEVGVDAASEPTYQLVRERGDFSSLMRNLNFLSGLRQSGSLKRLLLSFVVQRENFREIESFVRMARSFHVDTILFHRLADWNVMPADRFRRKAVHDPSHPEHGDFLEMIRRPGLSGSDIHWGNLSKFRSQS